MVSLPVTTYKRQCRSHFPHCSAISIQLSLAFFNLLWVFKHGWGSAGLLREWLPKVWPYSSWTKPQKWSRSWFFHLVRRSPRPWSQMVFCAEQVRHSSLLFTILYQFAKNVQAARIYTCYCIIYSNPFRFLSVLHKGISEYQEIALLDTKRFGKVCKLHLLFLSLILVLEEAEG